MAGTGYGERIEEIDIPIDVSESYSTDFSQFKEWLTQKAYLVSFIPHSLYSGLNMPTLPLTNLPNISFRCKIKVYPFEGHTDCTGSITVNTETMQFTEESTKIYMKVLSGLPTITTTNLDCKVDVTCIDKLGADISDESHELIDCRWVDKTRWYLGQGGIWTSTFASMFVAGELNVGVGTQVVFDRSNPFDPVNGIHYIAKTMGASTNEDGVTIIRRLDF